MKIKHFTVLQQHYQENPKLIRALLLFSLFFTAALAAPFFSIMLDYKPPIEDFSKHVISNGAITDFNVASRISLYYKSFFGILLVTGLVFLLLARYFRLKRHNSDDDTRSISALVAISSLGLFAIAAGFFKTTIEFPVFLLLLFGLFLLRSIKRSSLHHTLYATQWAAMAAFPFAVIAYQIIIKNSKWILSKQYFIQETILLPVEPRGLVLIGTFTFFTLFAHLFLKFFFRHTENNPAGLLKRDAFFKATLPLLLILPALSVCFEVLNIINLRAGRVINRHALLIAFIMVLAICLSCIRYIRHKKYSNALPSRANPLAQWYYPLFIISIALMAAQPWRQMIAENEFYESANHGLSVDHFFRYGMIPIVETFDAHMLNNQIFAYIYGFLNGYEPWSPFLYVYYKIVVEALIVYYVLKRLIGPSKALITCLCLPVISIIDTQFIYCGITALALLNVVRRGSNKDLYLFWLSVAGTCLFRLDLGFAVLTGGIISYLLLLWLGRQGSLKKFAITGSVVFGGILLLYVLLCLIKSINPVTRFIDFLTVAMSNQNWAFESLGETGHILFRMLYYVLPLVLLVLLVYTVLTLLVKTEVKQKIMQNPVSTAALVFFVYFAVVFFANAPRGIVRHSYLFSNSDVIAGTILLSFLSFIYIKQRPYNFAALLTVTLCFFLLDNIKTQTAQNSSPGLLYQGVNSESFAEKFLDAKPFNGSRMIVTYSMAEINLFKEITGKILKPDETYFDFSSNNYYYALVGKKNPLYVNQSPLLLNGDSSQQKALQVIKDNNIPMVLMPAGENVWRYVDDIPVDFKYYMLSEYIYQNYTPLIELTTCSVYVLKTKKAAYKDILKQTGIINTGDIVTGFSSVPPADIPGNDVTLQKSAEKLKITKSGDDPFIYGLIDLLQVKEKLNENLPVNITINIEPETTGTVQVFYIMPAAEGYTEESSKRFVMGAGVRQLAISLPALPKDLRIDLETPSLTVGSILFKNPEGAENSVAVQTEPVIEYPLGNLPRVWAEKSGNSLFEKVGKLQHETVGITVMKDIKQGSNKKPAYLFIEMESDTIHNASVSLLEDTVKKAGYSFITKKGRHQYTLRLSSNKSWWLFNINRLALTTERNVKVSKFAYLTEDGTDIQAGIDNYMTLSNVTDQNWYGGVGLMFNVFLMDNNASNRALKQGQKIQFADGRTATIKDVRPTGSYMHVEIFENVVDYKEAAAFPNTLKLIN